MTVPKSIALIGLSGTGKSTVGQAMARETGSPFIDTDRLVEQEAGMPVAEIFAKKGEPEFRKMEASAVRSAAQLRGVVIAAGGGAVENATTRRVLREHCTVVLLTASVRTLAERLAAASGERPLLSGCSLNDLPARLAALLEHRMPSYLETADIVVESEQPVPSVVAEILSRVAYTRCISAAGKAAALPPDAASVESVEVSAAGGRYSVYAGQGLIAGMGRRLQDMFGAGSRLVVVSNPVVSQLWLEKAMNSLQQAGLRAESVLIGDGERYKNLDTVSGLYDMLAANRHGRDSVIVALGGGVVGDTAGFAAATYMRGIPLVHVPTTLLAQVDSSVGGKVAVNHPQGKNLIGAFHQPRLVLSDTETVATLADYIFSEGMAEAIKTAVTGGEWLFNMIESEAEAIESREPHALRRMVSGCVRVKAGLVSGDERDTGKRQMLNFGHTFAHALEAACGYSDVSHGEAVAAGMGMAIRLSSALGLVHPDLQARILRLIRRFRLPDRASGLSVVPDAERVEECLTLDKKRCRGRLRLVLPAAIGDIRLIDDIPYALVRNVIHNDIATPGQEEEST